MHLAIAIALSLAPTAPSPQERKVIKAYWDACTYLHDDLITPGAETTRDPADPAANEATADQALDAVELCGYALERVTERAAYEDIFDTWSKAHQLALSRAMNNADQLRRALTLTNLAKDRAQALGNDDPEAWQSIIDSLKDQATALEARLRAVTPPPPPPEPPCPPPPPPPREKRPVELLSLTPELGVGLNNLCATKDGDPNRDCSNTLFALGFSAGLRLRLGAKRKLLFGLNTAIHTYFYTEDNRRNRHSVVITPQFRLGYEFHPRWYSAHLAFEPGMIVASNSQHPGRELHGGSLTLCGLSSALCLNLRGASSTETSYSRSSLLTATLSLDLMRLIEAHQKRRH